jgi:hypothetical protein
MADAAAYERQLCAFLLLRGGGPVSLAQVGEQCRKPSSISGSYGQFVRARPSLFQLSACGNNVSLSFRPAAPLPSAPAAALPGTAAGGAASAYALQLLRFLLLREQKKGGACAPWVGGRRAVPQARRAERLLRRADQAVPGAVPAERVRELCVPCNRTAVPAVLSPAKATPASSSSSSSSASAASSASFLLCPAVAAEPASPTGAVSAAQAVRTLRTRRRRPSSRRAASQRAACV